MGLPSNVVPRSSNVHLSAPEQFPTKYWICWSTCKDSLSSALRQILRCMYVAQTSHRVVVVVIVEVVVHLSVGITTRLEPCKISIHAPERRRHSRESLTIHISKNSLFDVVCKSSEVNSVAAQSRYKVDIELRVNQYFNTAVSKSRFRPQVDLKLFTEDKVSRK